MLLSLLLVTALSAAPEPTLRTAPGHPMRYYVSRPEGWAAGRSYPVVVVIEAAEREFARNLRAFEQARGTASFILVAPVVVTGGGANVRSLPNFGYSEATWDRVERDGPFRFDDEGLQAVLADVARQDGGEPRPFLTGWEAGGHTVFALLFRHPERWRAVALATPNYLRRWMDAGFSRAPERASLPVQVFLAGTPPIPAFVKQAETAVREARTHGFEHVTVTLLEGVPHGSLPTQVLAFFQQLGASKNAGAR